jgi:hypothetical protein
MFPNQNNKSSYRVLCDENKNIPLFMQAWWMDAVCGDEKWDVLIFEKDKKIIAVWVYHFRTKFGVKVIIQPQLTQHCGIWIDYPVSYSRNQRLAYEKEVMSNLIEQMNLINTSYFDQNFHHSFTNWLPFFWKGYQQTTRYTYQLQDLSEPENCFYDFTYSKKKQINKAKKTIKINFELSGFDFYDYLYANLSAVGQKVSYSKTLFMSLYEASKKRNQSCIVSAFDEQDNFHASLFIVWDQNSCYNLISTITPEFRSSGASSLVVWEAIKKVSAKTKIFDFEGSMDKGIENSFQQFGTVQVPYFNIHKYNSLLIKILCSLKK